MTRLRIFSENQPAQPELISKHHDDIARELGSIGVRFEQWEASQPVAPGTAEMARQLHQTHGIPILLEWDNDVPGMDVLNRELAWLRPSMTL